MSPLKKDNNPKKLGLKKPEKSLTPEQMQRRAAEDMATFYSNVGNAALNMAVDMHRIASGLDQLLIEMSDIKDNLNQMGLKEGWLSQMHIDERECEEGDDEQISK